MTTMMRSCLPLEQKLTLSVWKPSTLVVLFVVIFIASLELAINSNLPKLEHQFEGRMVHTSGDRSDTDEKVAPVGETKHCFSFSGDQ